MSNEDVADLLETTADRFESGEYTWIKSLLTTGDNNYCSIGALSAVVMGEAQYEVPLVQLAAMALLDHVDPDWRVPHLNRPVRFSFLAESVVTVWNDNEKRTLPEVIDAMKGAAKDLRNQS